MRANWSSQLTYILTVAGATIGFGATWRFPYLVGLNGGGAYVLVFCIAMILIGIPMILVENVIGRRSQTNSVDAFLTPKSDGTKIHKAWSSVGYLGLIGAFLILGYYMVLGGYVLVYIGAIALNYLDLTSIISTKTASDFYDIYIEQNHYLVAICTFIFVLINLIILRKGVVSGIEKSVRFLMPALLICLICVIVKNLFLENSLDGIIFYLKPDFSKIISFNPFYFNAKLFLMALGQVFFALSLGFGVMITLSSYLNKKENLFKTAFITGIINTLVAVACGFMIFPVLISLNINPTSGPSLVFKTLPVAFSHIFYGNIFAIIFFVLLLIAALTTSLSIYQVFINVLEEKLNLPTKKSTSITLLSIFIFGNIPCVFNFFDINFFNIFDYISGNIFFVLTAFLSCIYVGWVLKKDSIFELSNAYSLKSHLFKIWYFYIKFIIPFLILIIFISLIWN